MQRCHTVFVFWRIYDRNVLVSSAIFLHKDLFEMQDLNSFFQTKFRIFLLWNPVGGEQWIRRGGKNRVDRRRSAGRAYRWETYYCHDSITAGTMPKQKTFFYVTRSFEAGRSVDFRFLYIFTDKSFSTRARSPPITINFINRILHPTSEFCPLVLLLILWSTFNYWIVEFNTHGNHIHTCGSTSYFFCTFWTLIHGNTNVLIRTVKGQ